MNSRTSVPTSHADRTGQRSNGLLPLNVKSSRAEALQPALAQATLDGGPPVPGLMQGSMLRTHALALVDEFETEDRLRLNIGRRHPRMATTDMNMFKTKLLRPASPGEGATWTFLVLPKAASDPLPRRGRTSVAGTINGCPFQTTLDPDDQLSHWLKVSKELREAAHANIGEVVSVQIAPLIPEPEPQLPVDLLAALEASPEAKAGWGGTTTIARVDWIHWIESAKQIQTRKSRVESACEMLSSGKKRVCCFDPSGFYSKSLSAPQAAD